nr:carboxypeptidase regulatory-like domain-containing protein [Candidatus Kapabacteria bacterium]
AAVGVEFHYNGHATASNGAEIAYTLTEAPDGMTVNDTGLITWTPSEAGFYETALKAYLFEYPQVFMILRLTILVRFCEVPAVLSGTVLYEDNNPVQRGMVIIFKLGENPKTKQILANIENGEFLVELDQGSYLVRFGEGDFYPEWWQDAAEKADADTLIVNCGDAITIDAVVQKKEAPVYITFISEPIEQTVINTEYTYQAVAVASDSSEVRYYLIDPPDGMTINEETGLISWTPTEAGIYEVRIVAYKFGNENITKKQAFALRVSNCAISPIIVGTVLNQDNELVAGKVLVYQIVEGEPVQKQKQQLENGLFFFTLDEGTYYLKFSGDRVVEEWWQDSENFEGATAINLACGDTVTINAQVETVPQPEHYTVSGIVTRALDNSPVPFAIVEFFGKKFNSERMQIFRTTTNPQTGEYSINLSNQFTYISYCRTPNDTLINGITIPQLMPQYYNLATDVTTAEELVLTEDLTAINFNLAEQISYANSISGTVINKDEGPITDGFVIAYLIESGPWNEEYLFLGNTAQINPDGSYTITNLIPGNYVIAAVPYLRELAPGFYLENDFAVFNWLEATVLGIEETTGLDSIIIKLRDIHRRFGRCHFKGFIHGHKGGGGIQVKNNEFPQGEDPIAGAFVYIVDNENNIVDYIVTPKNGGYDFSELTTGQYSFVAAKVGFTPYIQEINIDEDNKTIDNGTIVINAVSSVDDNNGTEAGLVYPNPAQDNVFVRYYSSADKTANISVIGQNGTVYFDSTINVTSGTNEINIGLNNISQGVYFIIIDNGINRSINKFNVVR